MATIKAQLADADLALVRAAEAALDSLYDQYFGASAKDQFLLKPLIEHAAQGVLNARLSLLAPGTISAPADVAEAETIGAAVKAAATMQDLILGVARLIALVAKF